MSILQRRRDRLPRVRPFLPARWQPPRTGLGWQMDHFLGYFAATSIVWLAWPRRPWHPPPAQSKGGATATHPLLGDELRALRALKREAKSPFIFVFERGAPFSVAGLQKLVERAGIEAKLPFKVHPHMLRHATGFALANKGTDTRTLQAYLGHRSIQSTVRYTELAPGRFNNLWR